MSITKRLVLYGRVQGVGMRYSVSRIAKKLSLNGYVKNKMDGTVECVLQGEENIINMAILHIKDRTPGYIERVLEEELSYSKSFRNFQIRIF